MISWPVQVHPSKYSKWYEQLIDKARDRILPANSYYESHHIIPKSFNTENCNHKSNLVNLTAREHYIAHALLWKMKFPGLYGSKMAYAFNTFICKFKTPEHDTYKINSRLYESFRIEYAQMLSESMQGENNHFYGKKHSEETRRIIGEKSKLKEFKRGPENPNWGKTQNVSPEGKKRRLDGLKQRWADPEFREERAKKRKEFYLTPEGIAYRKAISDRTRGKKRDPRIMEKCAAAKRGKSWEEIYSPETVEKMRLAIKNRVLSDEAKAKIDAGRAKGCRQPKSKKPCIYCGKLCAGNMLKKWHNENCKHARPDTVTKEGKRKVVSKRRADSFIGPIRPNRAFEFRGVVYRSRGEASRASGKSGRRMVTEIKYWGHNPSKDITDQIDQGLLKPPVVAHNKGIPMSAEQKEACRKGTLVRLQKLRDQGLPLPNTGRKASEELKKKLSILATGRKHSTESKRKMSAARKGRPHSKEHADAIRLAKRSKRKK